MVIIIPARIVICGMTNDALADFLNTFAHKFFFCHIALALVHWRIPKNKHLIIHVENFFVHFQVKTTQLTWLRGNNAWPASCRLCYRQFLRRLIAQHNLQYCSPRASQPTDQLIPGPARLPAWPSHQLTCR
jgi:hypothetical protein